MAMTLITTNTSSNAASSSFTSSIDSTYKLYIFKFYDVNPATDAAIFTFQGNAAGASGYNETMTTTSFNAYHTEDDSGTPNVAYSDSYDQAQGTAYQSLSDTVGNGSDESCAGELHLFNPSSTTYVKHFYSQASVVDGSTTSTLNHYFVGGYINQTKAIDDIQFKMSSGNFDGKIKMWGVK